MVFVPYCTGDVHLGDATTGYAPELTVEHNGHVNASAGLDHLLEHFPHATDVFVTGSSAGGVPAPLFGGLVADALPDADVAVLADASGGYPSTPTLNAGIGGLWGTGEAIPDWPETADADPSTFGIPDLFHLAGAHAPQVRMARFDTAYDETQRLFSALAGTGDADLLAVLDQNEALVEGTSFVDWLTTLVDGGVPGDVRCTDCGEPAPDPPDAPG